MELVSIALRGFLFPQNNTFVGNLCRFSQIFPEAGGGDGGGDDDDGGRIPSAGLAQGKAGRDEIFP